MADTKPGHPPTPQNQEGPTESPPQLPEGWYVCSPSSLRVRFAMQKRCVCVGPHGGQYHRCWGSPAQMEPDMAGSLYQRSSVQR